MTLDYVLDVADYDLRSGAARADAGHGKGNGKLRNGTGSHEYPMDARIFINVCEVTSNYASRTWCDQAPLTLTLAATAPVARRLGLGVHNVKGAVFECEFVRIMVCIPDALTASAFGSSI